METCNGNYAVQLEEADPMRNYVVTSFLTLRKKAFIPLLDHNQKKFVVQTNAHWMKKAYSRKKLKKFFCDSPGLNIGTDYLTEDI